MTEGERQLLKDFMEHRGKQVFIEMLKSAIQACYENGVVDWINPDRTSPRAYFQDGYIAAMREVIGEFDSKTNEG